MAKPHPNFLQGFIKCHFIFSHQAQTTETTNFPTNTYYTQGAFMKIKFKVGYVCIFFYYEEKTHQSMMCYWISNEHNLA
jgi:hypothetical protein